MSTLKAQDTKSRQGAVPVQRTNVGDGNTATANMVTLVGGDGTVSTKPGVQDGGSAFSNSHGIAGVPFSSANASGADAAITAAPETGKKIVLTDLIISVNTDMIVTIKEETSGTVIAGPYYMAANSTMQVTPRSDAWRVSTIDKKAMVRSSAAGNISVDAHYHSED